MSNRNRATNTPLLFHTYSTCTVNNTFRPKYLFCDTLWQSFVVNPYKFLATNSTIGYATLILSLYKIIRLRRHYLPLVLRVVRPHWWKDARCWEKSASCSKPRPNARPRWLEVSLIYLADFLPDFFSQTNSLCLEDFLCYSKIITYIWHEAFSLWS